MAHPCGWMLVLGLLGPVQAPAALSEREGREATMARRSRAAEVALPADVARRLAGPSAADERQTVLMRGKQQIILETRPIDRGEEVAAQPPAGRGVVNVREMTLARENFESLVFPATHRGPADLQMHLHELLAARIRQVEEERALSDAERKRLVLAGSGDIQRLYARIAAARADFEAARLDYAAGMAAVPRLELLAIQYEEGPFGNGSLFRKTAGALAKPGG